MSEMSSVTVHLVTRLHILWIATDRSGRHTKEAYKPEATCPWRQLGFSPLEGPEPTAFKMPMRCPDAQAQMGDGQGPEIVTFLNWFTRGPTWPAQPSCRVLTWVSRQL